ncbi:MAG: hypothetical protein ACYDBB_26345 [Armatimonadota bacterium]
MDDSDDLIHVALDQDIRNADWTKRSWDLPPYKSPEFLECFGHDEASLAAFRKLPVYCFAVERGLIVNDEWVGEEGRERSMNPADARTIQAIHESLDRILKAYTPPELESVVFAEEFRRQIVQRGYLEPHELETIVRWKSPRTVPRAAENRAGLIQHATRCAFACDEPAIAAHVLTILKGVRARMASAILTVFDPLQHTVMDYRACKTLCNLGLSFTGLGSYEDINLDDCETYAIYLQACRQLAGRLNISLRTLDHFLWLCDGDVSWCGNLPR